MITNKIYDDDIQFARRMKEEAYRENRDFLAHVLGRNREEITSYFCFVSLQHVIHEIEEAVKQGSVQITLWFDSYIWEGETEEVGTPQESLQERFEKGDTRVSETIMVIRHSMDQPAQACAVNYRVENGELSWKDVFYPQEGYSVAGRIENLIHSILAEHGS